MSISNEAESMLFWIMNGTRASPASTRYIWSSTVTSLAVAGGVDRENVVASARGGTLARAVTTAHTGGARINLTSGTGLVNVINAEPQLGGEKLGNVGGDHDLVARGVGGVEELTGSQGEVDVLPGVLGDIKGHRVTVLRGLAGERRGGEERQEGKSKEGGLHNGCQALTMCVGCPH